MISQDQLDAEQEKKYLNRIKELEYENKLLKTKCKGAKELMKALEANKNDLINLSKQTKKNLNNLNN